MAANAGRRPADRAGRNAATWSTPWDDRISRDHAQVSWSGSRLRVDRLPSARNPIFVRGQPSTGFEIEPGEHFVIGQTTFTLADERVNVSIDVPQPAQEQAFSSRYLQQIQFRHADAHIDVLSKLPAVISGAGSDAELYVRLVNSVLSGVSRASAAALVALRPRPIDRRSKCCNGTAGK